MAIGTSLGAFFETEFDHHTGNELNMDAKDNNEWSPNEIMPHPEEEPKIIPIANLTNTPDEIMSGLEGVRVWHNRGVAGPTQMRRPANDNKDLQIHDPVMDKNIEYSWSRMVRGQQIVSDRQTLINTQSERALNDIEKARLSRLDKEHANHFGNYYPD